jgi:hypothetical protein
MAALGMVRAGFGKGWLAFCCGIWVKPAPTVTGVAILDCAKFGAIAPGCFP